MPNPPRHVRRGSTMVLWILVAGAIVGIGSLAVDFSRLKSVQDQMRTALESASLAGASNLSSGISATINAAITAAAANQVDGQPVVITASNIQLGVWDPDTETFSKLTGAARAAASAVRVTYTRPSVDTGFAGYVGFSSVVDITQEAIATRGVVTHHAVTGKACPWLAGMPDGSEVLGYGGNPRAKITAPDYSPYRMGSLNVTPGANLYFRDIEGFTTYEGNITNGPEGELTRMATQQLANGINSTTAPIMALVGIFLDDRRPDTYAAAPTMNFSTAAQRNFSQLTPQLKQVFFIGDGQNDSNQLQKFIVPAGATRLYLGIMDEKGWWWDNENPLTTTMLEGSPQIVRCGKPAS